MPIYPNPDLVAESGHLECWNRPEQRRKSFHNLHRLTRYGFSLRASKVLGLISEPDSRIAQLPSVKHLTQLSVFSALVVLRGEHNVHEQYAVDFSADQAHSIMSITKTMTHLIMGRCIAEGLVDPSRSVHEYLPGIGTGYADAVVQDVLDMNIVNSYSEDYSDSDTTALRHNASLGWRLPPPGESEIPNREFLCKIRGDTLANFSGLVNYKSANTDVLAWIAELVTGRSLKEHFIEIIEAAGIEDTFYMSTDCTGVPNTNGGACMSALDLARYGLVFSRKGRGVTGETIGSWSFIEAARRCRGPTYPPPDNHIHYGNQLKTNGRWIGHSGWGGQLLLIDPETSTVVVFFSVLENESASDDAHSRAIVRMAEDIIEL